MVGIDSQEGQPSMCGVVMRRWLDGSNAGRNVGNTGENTGGNATKASEKRQQQHQGAPVVTPGGPVRCDASAASGLRCLGTGLASVEGARCAGGLSSPERPPSDTGMLHGPSSYDSTAPAFMQRGDQR